MAINDNTLYGLTGAQIKELPGKINAAKGQAKVLTSDDYDYPVDNPIKVAAWLLEPGVYTAAPGVRVAGDTTAMAGLNSGVTLIIGATDSNNKKSIIMIPYTASDSMFPGGARTEMVDATTGAFSSADTWLASKNTKDSLTSNSTWEPLSANQGKVLKGLTDSIAIRGAGAPTTLTVGQVGTLYEDTTNGDLYICTDATNPYVWEEVGAGGGSGITELTSADYNYPTNNPTSVALWKLNSGAYMWGSVEVKSSSSTDVSNDHFAIVGEKQTGGGTVNIVSLGDGSSQTSGNYNLVNTYMVEYSNGNLLNSKYALTRDNVTQSTGTSTTAVMSQNAVTSMVYADPSTQRRVKIGSSSSANQYSVGIGNNASASGIHSISLGDTSTANQNGAVAIGAYSSTSSVGEMNIGSSSTSYGYNSSNYRLLTGLYDPQSDHDAATKGYVDGLVGNIESALNAINNGGNA